MAKRKGISKRVRFEIFKRDGFKCLHCGAGVNESALHVDHLKPVAEGGTDEPSNLATACASCNLGKGAVPLDRVKLHRGKATEAQREHAEQIREWMKIQSDVMSAKGKATDMMVAHWVERVGSRPSQLASRLARALGPNSVEEIFEAIDIVAVRMHNERETEQLKYFYGCLKNFRSAQEPAPKKKTGFLRDDEPRKKPDSAICEKARAAMIDAIAGAKNQKPGPRHNQDWTDIIVAAIYAAVGLPAEEIEFDWLTHGSGTSIGPVVLLATPRDGEVSWSVRDASNFDPWSYAFDEISSAIRGAIDPDPDKPEKEWVDHKLVLEAHRLMDQLEEWAWEFSNGKQGVKK